MLANHRTAVDEHRCGKVDNRGREALPAIEQAAAPPPPASLARIYDTIPRRAAHA